jgi:AAA+ ATPase superfamily predicted ATPase
MGYQVKYGHPDDRPLVATPNEYKEFIEGGVWKDMQTFLMERIEDVKNDLVKAVLIDDVRMLQAEAQALQLMAALPFKLQEWAEQDQEGKENG